MTYKNFFHRATVDSEYGVLGVGPSGIGYQFDRTRLPYEQKEPVPELDRKVRTGPDITEKLRG